MSVAHTVYVTIAFYKCENRLKCNRVSVRVREQKIVIANRRKRTFSTTLLILHFEKT